MSVTKRCPNCRQDKASSDFWASTARRPDGTQTYCKTCARAKAQAYRDANGAEILKRRREQYAANAALMRARAKVRRDTDPEGPAKASRKHYLKKRYGLTPEQYDAMVAERQGRCDVCGDLGTPQKKWKAPLHVDHCHKSGAVRGLLCSNCNTGLGLLGDDVNRLRSAISYLTASSIGANT